MHFKLHGLTRMEHLCHAKSDNWYYFRPYVQEYKRGFPPHRWERAHSFKCGNFGKVKKENTS